MKKIYLALGSNLGDRTQFLSLALSTLINRGVISSPLRVSPVYQSKALLKSGAMPAWDKDFLNLVLEARSSLEAPTILSQLKEIEKDLGREMRERWAPREIDIDLLFYGDQKLSLPQLEVPHPEVARRDFWLEPLKDLLGDEELPLLKCSAGALLSELQDLNRAEKLPLALLPSEFVSVLNITPDSFSDGGRFNEVDSALQQAELQVAQGCSVLDIGAESTRPGAQSLSADQEWSRLKDVIPALSWFRSRKAPWVKLSIDTRKARVVEQALEYSFDWVNDVSAAEDPQMLDHIKRTDVKYIFMHNMGVPAEKKSFLDPAQDPVTMLRSWAEGKRNQFVSQGIVPERLIWDPGIGFGKVAQHSSEILSRLNEFDALGLDMLVGHSRKSFLNLITDKNFSDRDLETAMISARLQSFEKVRYIRVHDVQSSIRATRASLLCEPQRR